MVCDDSRRHPSEDRMTPEDRAIADNWLWAIDHVNGEMSEGQCIILPPDLYALINRRKKELEHDGDA